METKTDLYKRTLFMRERVRLERKAKNLALGALKGLVKSAGTPPGSTERSRAIKYARAVIKKLDNKEIK